MKTLAAALSARALAAPAARYAKTRFLGVEREPPYYTSVDTGKVVTVVR